MKTIKHTKTTNFNPIGQVEVMIIAYDKYVKIENRKEKIKRLYENKK